MFIYTYLCWTVCCPFCPHDITHCYKRLLFAFASWHTMAFFLTISVKKNKTRLLYPGMLSVNGLLQKDCINFHWTWRIHCHWCHCSKTLMEFFKGFDSPIMRKSTSLLIDIMTISSKSVWTVVHKLPTSWLK